MNPAHKALRAVMVGAHEWGVTSVGRLAILFLLAEKQCAVPVKYLAESLKQSSSWTSQLVEKLELDDMVTCVRDEVDARSKLVSIGERGARVVIDLTKKLLAGGAP